MIEIPIIKMGGKDHTIQMLKPAYIPDVKLPLAPVPNTAGTSVDKTT